MRSISAATVSPPAISVPHRQLLDMEPRHVRAARASSLHLLEVVRSRWPCNASRSARSARCAAQMILRPAPQRSASWRATARASWAGAFVEADAVRCSRSGSCDEEPRRGHDHSQGAASRTACVTVPRHPPRRAAGRARDDQLLRPRLSATARSAPAADGEGTPRSGSPFLRRLPPPRMPRSACVPARRPAARCRAPSELLRRVGVDDDQARGQRLSDGTRSTCASCAWSDQSNPTTIGCGIRDPPRGGPRVPARCDRTPVLEMPRPCSPLSADEGLPASAAGAIGQSSATRARTNAEAGRAGRPGSRPRALL